MKDLAMHIIDLTQNSILAGASEITIELAEDRDLSTRVLTTTDNGQGIEEKMLARIEDPWFTTRKNKRVGLGIPLLRQSATQTGGDFGIQSIKGEGTKVTALFYTNHIDCIPLGDIAGTMVFLMLGNPKVTIVLRIINGTKWFELSGRQLLDLFDGVPLQSAEVRAMVNDYLQNNVNEILEGKL